jgi:hypothetical protein
LPDNQEGAVSDADLAAAATRSAAQARGQKTRDAAMAAAVKLAMAKAAEDAEFDTLAEFQSQKADDHFLISIPSSGKDDEVKRVFVGVNGVPYTILRDEEVMVPKAVLAALDIAVETRYREKTVEGHIVKVPYKVRSYPYVVVSGPHEPTPPAGHGTPQ